jgi:hypothetical protein
LRYGSHSALSFGGFSRHLSWQRKRRAISRRRLALGTEIAAAPGNNRAPDQGGTAVAALTFAPISAMVALIFTRLALGVKEIGDRRAADRDGFLEDFPQHAMQLLQLFFF